jgi:hypothetical protein
MVLSIHEDDLDAHELDELDDAHGRRVLADRRPDGDASGLEDADVLTALREPWLENWRRPRLDRLDRPTNAPDAFETAVDLRSLVPDHRIAFLVVDARQRPLEGVAYVLEHEGRELERGCTPKDGMVRRDGVIDAEWRVRLPGIDLVSWVESSVDAQTEAMLHVRTSGLPDGTSLEILVFEELCEADDAALATIAAEVRGDVAVGRWQCPSDRTAMQPAAPDVLHVVAEVRGPNGAWAKTQTPLAVRLPAVVAVEWSAEEAAPGASLDVVARTSGLPDGTCVTFDVWRVGWAGDDVHLGTLADVPIAGGKASALWRFDPESDAPVSMECWCTATVLDPVERSASSDLVRILG